MHRLELANLAERATPRIHAILAGTSRHVEAPCNTGRVGGDGGGKSAGCLRLRRRNTRVDAFGYIPITLLTELTSPPLDWVGPDTMGANRGNVLATSLALARVAVQLATVLAILPRTVAVLAQITSPAGVTSNTSAVLQVKAATVLAVRLRAGAFVAQLAFPGKFAMCALTPAVVVGRVQNSPVRAVATRGVRVIDVTDPLAVSAIAGVVLSHALASVQHTEAPIRFRHESIPLHIKRALRECLSVNRGSHVLAFWIPGRALKDTSAGLLVATVATIDCGIGARVNLRAISPAVTLETLHALAQVATVAKVNALGELVAATVVLGRLPLTIDVLSLTLVDLAAFELPGMGISFVTVTASALVLAPRQVRAKGDGFVGHVNANRTIRVHSIRARSGACGLREV